MEPQEDKLRQEILADAKKRADRIIARANSDAGYAEKRAAATNAKLREDRLAAAKATGETRHRNIIQGLWGEKRQMWLRAREESLDAFFLEIRKAAEALPDADPRREQSLAALAAEAGASLQAPELVAAINPRDARIVTPEWLRRQCPGTAFTVAPDAAIDGGIRLSTPDGRECYDNTYAGRLHRLHASFREAIAHALPATAL